MSADVVPPPASLAGQSHHGAPAGHAGAGYLVGHTSIELGVRNLFDQKYVELQAGNYLVPGQPIRVYGSVQYVF